MSDPVIVKYEVDDQYSQPVENIIEKAEEFDKTVVDSTKNLAKWGLQFSAVAAVGVASILKLTEMSKQQREAEEGVRLALEKTGQNSDKAYKAILKQASAMQQITELGDEQLLPMYSRLIMSTNDANKAFELMPVIADLAASSGKTFEETFNKISMSFAGSTRGLKEFGIEVERGAGKEEIFRALTEELTALDGAAQRNAQTFSQMWSNSFKIMQDSLEPIGEILETKLFPLGNLFFNLSLDLQNFINENRELVADMLVLGTAVSGLVAGFLSLGAGIGAIGLIVPSLVAGFGAVMTAISGVVAGLLSPAGLIGAIGLVAGAFFMIPEKALDAIGQLFSSLIKMIPQFTQYMIANVINLVASTVVLAVEIMWNALSKLPDLLFGLFDIITNVLKGIAQTIGNAFLIVFQKPLSIIQDWINRLISMANSMLAFTGSSMRFGKLEIDFAKQAKAAQEPVEGTGIAKQAKTIFSEFAQQIGFENLISGGIGGGDFFKNMFKNLFAPGAIATTPTSKFMMPEAEEAQKKEKEQIKKQTSQIKEQGEDWEAYRKANQDYLKKENERREKERFEADKADKLRSIKTRLEKATSEEEVKKLRKEYSRIQQQRFGLTEAQQEQIALSNLFQDRPEEIKTSSAANKALQERIDAINTRRKTQVGGINYQQSITSDGSRQTTGQSVYSATSISGDTTGIINAINKQTRELIAELRKFNRLIQDRVRVT